LWYTANDDGKLTRLGLAKQI